MGGRQKTTLFMGVGGAEKRSASEEKTKQKGKEKKGKGKKKR